MRNSYDHLLGKACAKAEDYYEIRVQQSAEHGGECWFKHADLAERANEIKHLIEAMADIFDREEWHFRTGEH